jgi:DNA gyrase/topoisomerase IV subunit A
VTQVDIDPGSDPRFHAAQERAHILEALIVASDNIDEVVHIIRAAKNPQEAIDMSLKVMRELHVPSNRFHQEDLFL